MTKQEPVKIAFAIDTINSATAGTEKQLLLLMNSLDRSRFEPHLICLRSSTWLASTTFDFPVMVLDLNTLLSVQSIRAFRHFRAYVRDRNIRVVQTFFLDSNLFGTVAAFLSRVKVIVSSRRNFGKGYWHTPLWLFVLKVLRWMTTFYIANSRTTGDYSVQVEKMKPERMHVICNGLDLRKYDAITPELRRQGRKEFGLTDDELLIGIVANFRPIKNLALFVEMARGIYERYPQARFVMVGDGEEKPALKARIREYGLSSVVRIPGRTEDVLPVVAAMDIGVLCSKAESLSNSIIEYMAAGLPCVVSDIGGNLEALGDTNGLTFKSGDKNDFIDKVEKLILDPDLRRQLGRQASAYVESTYDHKVVTRQHERLYEKYLSGGSKE